MSDDRKEVDALLKKISESFVWVEQMNMRVGEIWLHPDQTKILKLDHGAFDRLAQRAVIDAMRRPEQHAECIGFLFGAHVYESDKVVVNHACIVPDGWTVKDPGCCMPL